MKSFVLADLSRDFTITIAKKEFSLKKGMSYRFNFASKSDVKEVLKCLAKNKGLFRYLETTSFVNCVQTFSLAKERAAVESTKLSTNFKSGKKKSSLEKVKVDKEESEEVEEGRGFLPEDVSLGVVEDLSE